MIDDITPKFESNADGYNIEMLRFYSMFEAHQVTLIYMGRFGQQKQKCSNPRTLAHS